MISLGTFPCHIGIEWVICADKEITYGEKTDERNVDHFNCREFHRVLRLLYRITSFFTVKVILIDYVANIHTSLPYYTKCNMYSISIFY